MHVILWIVWQVIIDNKLDIFDICVNLVMRGEKGKGVFWVYRKDTGSQPGCFTILSPRGTLQGTQILVQQHMGSGQGALGSGGRNTARPQ